MSYRDAPAQLINGDMAIPAPAHNQYRTEVSIMKFKLVPDEIYAAEGWQIASTPIDVYVVTIDCKIKAERYSFLTSWLEENPSFIKNKTV